jgi:thiol-disulfide isomerase/thioredoxin
MIRHRVLIAAIVLFACAGTAPKRALHVPPLEGKPLDLTAQDLSGKEVRVEGPGQVVVVDFFASWCGPCREQLPFLDRMARELVGEGLRVFGVAFDEEHAAAAGFAAEVGAGFPILWDPGGARLGPALQIDRLPTTVLVDRRGVVRAVRVGYRSGEDRELEAAIRALLAEH